MRHLHLWKPGNYAVFDNFSPEAEAHLIAEAATKGFEVIEQIEDHTACEYQGKTS